MDKNNNIHIGLSGWSFDWDSVVGEERIPSSRRIEVLSLYFDTAEANYPFYRLPKIKTYEKWKKQAGEDFIFSVKLSRYISHIKRLRGIKTPLGKFLRRYKYLGSKAGPILVQLPANLKADFKLLFGFLSDFADVCRKMAIPLPFLAFEFRHPSWFEGVETEKILARYGACLVFSHSSRYPYPNKEPETSSEFVYFRMHGPGELFNSEYGRERLAEWKGKILKYAKNKDVYVYFNNDGSAYSAKDALELKRLIREQ